jgi:transcription antitermination factor NusG
MAYWAVARLQPHRERLALHCLALAGFTVYLPRLRSELVSHGRRTEMCPSLFPGYAFVSIELQWSKARYAPGIVGLIMNGAGPARVSDQVIAGIRAHEVHGAVELPKSSGPKLGDHVKILGGPFRGHLAVYAGMKSRQRVEVLLALLGGQQRVILPRADVEARATS